MFSLHQQNTEINVANIWIVVFLVLTLCSLLGCCQHFRGTCCLVWKPCIYLPTVRFNVSYALTYSFVLLCGSGWKPCVSEAIFSHRNNWTNCVWVCVRVRACMHEWDHFCVGLNIPSPTAGINYFGSNFTILGTFWLCIVYSIDHMWTKFIQMPLETCICLW
jgi:hypothetical protein